MSAPAVIAFDCYTAVDPTTGTASAANAPAGFLGVGGGFAAAIALRAMTQTVSDASGPPRALTIRLLAPIRAETPVTVTAALDRAGRSTTAISAQLQQARTTVALSHALFARPGGSIPGPRRDITMPIVPEPEHCAPLAIDPTGGDGLGAHVERRPASKDMLLSGSPLAQLLVWMRLGQRRPLDALSIAFLADAVVPPLYAALQEPAAIPSLEITIHYAAHAHRVPASDDTGWVLGSFRHVDSTEGFVSDDERTVRLGSRSQPARPYVAKHLRARAVRSPGKQPSASLIVVLAR